MFDGTTPQSSIAGTPVGEESFSDADTTSIGNIKTEEDEKEEKIGAGISLGQIGALEHYNGKELIKFLTLVMNSDHKFSLENM